MSSVVISERMPNTVIVPIGTQAATITLPGAYFRKHSRIKAVHFINQASLAADNTNYLQVSLQTVAGVAVATLDTRAANQGALTAMVPVQMPLSAPVGDVTYQPEADVAAATALQVVVTKNGTGVPTSAALQIEWYPL